MTKQGQVEQRVDVGAYLRRLSIPKTTREHFSIPLPAADVATLLRTAVSTCVRERYRTYVDDQYSQKLITALTSWLIGEDKSKPCCIILGTVGNGKTTLLYAIQKLLNVVKIADRDGDCWGLPIINARSLAIECKTHSSSESVTRYAHYRLLAIDDLGSEPRELMDYGNIITPLADLIMDRYEYNLPTIITSNLRPREVREVYGARVADRLNESYKIIIADGASRRQ